MVKKPHFIEEIAPFTIYGETSRKAVPNSALTIFPFSSPITLNNSPLKRYSNFLSYLCHIEH